MLSDDVYEGDRTMKVIFITFMTIGALVVIALIAFGILAGSVKLPEGMPISLWQSIHSGTYEFSPAMSYQFRVGNARSIRYSIDASSAVDVTVENESGEYFCREQRILSAHDRVCSVSTPSVTVKLIDSREPMGAVAQLLTGNARRVTSPNTVRVNIEALPAN